MLALIGWLQWIPVEIDLGNIYQPPSFSHPLGTDHLGRSLLGLILNYFSLTVFPLWVLLLGGWMVGIVAGVCCAALGYYQVQRILLLLSGIPPYFLVFVVAILLGNFAWSSVFTAMFIIVFVHSFCRTYGNYIRDHRKAYWLAHKALGGTVFSRIWFYGVFGSWKKELLGLILFQLQAVLVMEVSLSYLGFGISENSLGALFAANFHLALSGEVELLAVLCLALVLLFNLIHLPDNNKSSSVGS